jgi:voltage-gated potassium channel Kch
MKEFSDLQPVVENTEALASQISPVLFGGFIFLLILACHALFCEVVTQIHHRITLPLKQTRGPWLARPVLYFSILLLVVSHLVEIAIWGYALYWSGLAKNLSEALYFSGSTYTTLGYGSDILPESLNAITAVIALSGMFSIAWTTSILMSNIGAFRPVHASPPREKSTPG